MKDLWATFEANGHTIDKIITMWNRPTQSYVWLWMHSMNCDACKWATYG